MAELITLISKIPAEVVKALENEENKQSQDVNAADKEAGREDDFKNEDCSDLQALEDEVGGTVTDSIQAAVDTILFDLSTPSTTKSLDVRELQASKVKTPAKRERKKSRVLRSPYISKYDSGSKDADDFDKVEKLKYAFYGYTINQDLPNELMIDYSQWIAVGLLKTHSAKYMTINSFFKTYVEKTHTRYYPEEPAVEISTQQDYAKSIMVAKNEDAIANIIHGFCMLAGLPWDCGIFVCAYAEILSEGLQVHSRGFDAASQRACYASLQWHYRVKKANEGYTSDNGDPPRPRKNIIEEIDASAIVTLE
ncbi:hypothetical protein BC332_13314 [Capsicum chinense]|nr:hypothetical protein BC332_13314 [Capsicum chinense]